MKQDSRIKNTKRNIVTSYISTIISFVFQFVSRTLIVYYLGKDYLGIQSLFASILQVLGMAELGFSGAIIFNMYKPIAQGDTKQVCALLEYYKKIYRRVGAAVFIIGTVIAPFLPHLINGHLPNGMNLYVLYFLYLINTGISYFMFAYKSALLTALQRLDLVTIANIIVSILQYTLQIVSLAIFKNFYYFLIITIIATIAKNLVASFVSEKKYPEFICKGEVSKETKNDIVSRVKGLLVCNISSVTYTTFDSIILSAFIGLTSVAIYNNYIIIYSALITFITLIRTSMQASIGNKVAVSSVEENYNDMLLWQFLFSFIASWCAIILLCLYQPFMKLWMGNDMLLPFSGVVMISMWLFVVVIQHSYFLYLAGNGLWWEMRWSYIMSTIINLLLNIILGKIFGIVGVIFSSLFSTLVFGIFWQCRIIFKHYFCHSCLEFYKRQLLYFIVTFFSAIITYLTCDLIKLNNILGVFCKGIISVFLPMIIMLIIYKRTRIYKKAKKLFIATIKS